MGGLNIDCDWNVYARVCELTLLRTGEIIRNAHSNLDIPISLSLSRNIIAPLAARHSLIDALPVLRASYEEVGLTLGIVIRCIPRDTHEAVRDTVQSDINEWKTPTLAGDREGSAWRSGDCGETAVDCTNSDEVLRGEGQTAQGLSVVHLIRLCSD
ncbi:hypothetical protein WR25_04598 [Diploscapter pachys]|uniref:Uncharacterized protein n=1 Tax=Diploscapter pachys TaxID=2018661 RepID=A0A2A2LKT2_9BILA|nr:hypothetical protein WR25_04598 [Diploscapter pachys]